jgi:hypothetical protein
MAPYPNQMIYINGHEWIDVTNQQEGRGGEMNPQAQILEMLKARGRVKTSEILRAVPCTTPAKAILRLREKGHPIENVSPPGAEAVYVYKDGGQMRLI